MRGEFNMSKLLKSLALLVFCVTVSATTMVAVASAATSEATNVNQIEKALKKTSGAIFPLGEYNQANKDNFTGDSYVARLESKNGVNVANVTFVKGAHTHWHIHHGTCQILLAESGSGYYQIWGEAAKRLKPGESVTIPEGIKHWHGAAPGKMFQHVVITGPAKYTTEWLEPVNDEFYQELN